jgi:hypothetical protein
MKTGVIILASLLLTAMTVQAFGQSKLPEGQWVLENLSAFEEGVQKTISMDDLAFEMPAEIDIRQAEIVFVRKESTETVKYDTVANGISLCFPICAEWSITENKLQLQWTQDKESGQLIIILTYSQK